MNSIHILVEGYASITKTGWKASGTTCLITTEAGKHILTDPGANKALLLDGLAKYHQTLDSIDFVFLTHHHIDHALLAGIFPNAKVIDKEALYENDKAIAGIQVIPGTDIGIVPTPGHEVSHAVLVVPNAAEGTVVIAGDNFWW